MQLKTPRGEVRGHAFNKHVTRHHFCPACACAPFSEGAAPQGSTKAAIDVRGSKGVDVATLQIHQCSHSDR